MLDLCGSWSGVGTLGWKRYLVLVKGGDRHHLIDMKQAAPAALSREFRALQPRWECDTERIATVQHYTQYVPIAHLGWTRHRSESFVLSDFQPAEDRVDSTGISEREHERFARKLGRLLAWAHLRTASWKRSASIDDLMSYAATLNGPAQRSLLRSAAAVGRIYHSAYQEFLKAQR